NVGALAARALVPGRPLSDAGISIGAPSLRRGFLARSTGDGFAMGAFESQWPSSPPKPIFVVSPDAGSPQQVKVYSAPTGQLVSKFYAFNPGFTGGVRVAVADMNGDGVRAVIVASGPGGGPQVKVIDGTKLNQLHANCDV